MGCLSVNFSRVGGIDVTATNVGGLEVNVLMVCTPAQPRLKVRPVETQWVDVNLYADYDIIFPREWFIE